MPPSVATGHHVDDVGEHFALAPSDASINAWSPHGRYTPATVAMIALSVSAVVRSCHQEDDYYPVLARRRETTLAVIFKTVLELKDKGGRASGFQPQLGFVAFRAGIG